MFYYYKLHFCWRMYVAELFSDVYCIRLTILSEDHWMLLNYMAYFSSIYITVHTHWIFLAVMMSGSDNSRFHVRLFLSIPNCYANQSGWRVGALQLVLVQAGERHVCGSSGWPSAACLKSSAGIWGVSPATSPCAPGWEEEGWVL